MQNVFNSLFLDLKKFFILLLLVTFFLRLSSLLYDFLDVDESIFAFVAHRLMEGGVPYLDALDNKPPFIFLFYQIIFSIFGKYNMLAVHVVTVFWVFFTAWVIYKISENQGESRVGLWASLFYVIFSTTFLPKFIATNINIIMMLPVSLSVLFWLKSLKSRSVFYPFLSGLFVGVSFMFKFQGGIQLAVYLFFILFEIILYRKINWRAVFNFCLCGFGFICVILCTLVWLYSKGALSLFYQWVVLGSFQYIGSGSETIPVFKNFIFRGGAFMASSLVIWGLLFLSFRKENFKNQFYIFLFAWLALSFIPVFMGGRFYGHYFIQLLPPLCLMAGWKANQLASIRWIKAVFAFSLIPALFFWGLRLDFKKIDRLFPDDQIFDQKEVGQFLYQNTLEKETVYVWGFAPAIYFYSQRTPASRYVWSDLLTGKIPGSEKSNDPGFDTQKFVPQGAWDILWEDFKKRPPTYFVDTSTADMHHYGKYPVSNYPRLFQYLQEYYVKVGEVKNCLIYKRKTGV